jgi:hypothetical protein
VDRRSAFQGGVLGADLFYAKELADYMGLAATIERAGGQLVPDMGKNIRGQVSTRT